MSSTLLLGARVESLLLASWFWGAAQGVGGDPLHALLFAGLALLAMWHNPVCIDGRDMRVYPAVGLAFGLCLQALLSQAVSAYVMLSFSMAMGLLRWGQLKQANWYGHCRPHVVTASLVGLLLVSGLINGGWVPGDSTVVTMLQLQAVLLFLMAGKHWPLSAWVLPLFVLLACSLWLSNLLASQQLDVLATGYRAWAVMGHWVFACFVFAYVRDGNLRPLQVLLPVLACMLFLGAIYLLTWYGMQGPQAYDWFYDPPLYRHIRHHSYFNCLAVCAALLLLFHIQSSYRLPAFGLLILAFTLLLWNGGRGSILSVLLVLPIIMLGYGLKRRLGTWGLVVLAFGLGLLLAYLYRVDHGGMGWYSAILRSDRADSVNALSSGRLWIWGQLMEHIQQRPFFGWGGDGFKSVWPTDGVRQAHNGLFQLLIEWGVVGTLLVLLAIVPLYLKGLWCFVTGERNELLTLGLVLVTAMLAFAMVDGIFYFALPGMFLALGLGIVAGAMRGEVQN